MAKKKRILNIQPEVGDLLYEPMKKILDRYVSPDFEVDYRGVKYGGYEGFYYMAVTVPYIVDEIIQAEKEGYAAVISQCFCDPGVSEAREAVRIPVVGAGEAAVYVAMMCGDRLGIVTTGGTYRTQQHGATLRLIRNKVISWGISDRIVYYGTTGLNEFPAVDSPEAGRVLDALERESQKATEEKGAEVIVLGCTYLTGFAVELQKRLDVPVVDSSIAPLKFAELLVTMNLTHSRLTTPSPGLLGVKPVMKWPPTLREYPG
jgi:allantoin racemase